MPLYETPFQARQFAHAMKRTISSVAPPTLPAPLPEQGLSDHLRQCQHTHPLLNNARCACLSASCFIAARLFTTVVILSITSGVIIWLFGSTPLP